MIEFQENKTERWDKELETWKKEQNLRKQRKKQNEAFNANLPAGNPQTLCHSVVKRE